MKTLGLSDVIGPIMVGPSSSHTAGALRIAYMARRLCLAEPKTVEFRLLGSFAHTPCASATRFSLRGMRDSRSRSSRSPTRNTTIPTPSTCTSWTPRATR